MLSTTYIKTSLDGDSLTENIEDIKSESSLNKEIRKETQRSAYVWCWGRNKNGELSLGNSRNINIPRDTRGIKSKKIKQICSGEKHSAVVTADGELLICGSYLHGTPIQ